MTQRNLEDPLRAADDRVRKTLPPGVKLVRTLRGHTDTIGRIAWSPCGRLIASPSFDRTVRVWSAMDGEPLQELIGHTRRVFAVAWSPSGKLLASAGDEERLRIWDPETGEQILKLRRMHRYAITSLAWSPDGGRLASGGWDGTVVIWDVESFQPLVQLTCDRRHVNCLAWTHVGDRLAAGGDSTRPTMWDTHNWNRISCDWMRGSGRAGGVYGLTWSGDDKQLYCASGNGTVIVYTPEDSATFYMEGHTGEVRSVSLSADGQLVASKGAVNDNSVRLWRSDPVSPICRLAESSTHSWRPSLAFHPSAPVLATLGDRETGIRIWQLDPSVLLGQPTTQTVMYTSTKVVMVGESNVGKSYLAHRIATGLPPKEGAIRSTHGMTFWSLDPEQLSRTARAPVGQRRDIVLWDMGGQEEYRLIHQLFLHDTTVALVLLDPTRGVTAFKEVETWNKYLDKQLSGRNAVKLLIGAKMDQASDTVDHKGLERILKECGFAGYYETSAITGRGIAELSTAMANSIDWDGLGLTSRPELFQRIRDEIEARRRSGEVVLHVAELRSAVFRERRRNVGKAAVDAVTNQLATQGVIARSRVSTGEAVIVLQVQKIERYAGSLIVAARNNPRGVPALELRAIAQTSFELPGIARRDRLPRSQERPIMECTVQLMLEHGVCFEHEGLLIFPTLFPAPLEPIGTALPHAVSLYYDVAGAIDNIYASLIAWLVLARDFGRLRLWPDRAEFEVKDGGLCGVRKVGRPGGFAHVDVYFEVNTPPELRQLFISFVDEHLRLHGVEIREHVAVTCACGEQIEEEVIRKRIARGDRDVRCPVCETRHGLTEGASEVRERDPKLMRKTWALKTQIERRQHERAEQAVRIIENVPSAKAAPRPIRLLHLSDLHFTAETPVNARLQWLLDDLKLSEDLGLQELDYLVISGDFTHRGSPEGFEKAYDFVSGLTREFALSAERCIFVPGNHDVRDLREAYEWQENADGLNDGEWLRQGDIILRRDSERYPLRFKPFSDLFFHKFVQKPYPLEWALQGIAVPFWETGIQFLALNSCWQIDQFHRERVGLHPEAVASTIRQAQKQRDEATGLGQLPTGKAPLRIAIWHHSVAAPGCKMRDVDFIGHLQNNNVRIGLHGDVHELRRELIGYWHPKKLHIVGSGSFGARAQDRPESTPRLYNILEIDRGLDSARVHTRCQPKPDGPWKGWYEWDDPEGGKGRVPYYDISW